MPFLPRELPDAHRRWIVVNAIVGAAVANLVINALIALLFTSGMSTIPLFKMPLLGGTNVITDTVGTFFLLPLITCLVITSAVRKELRNGALARLPGAKHAYPSMLRLPPGKLARGAAFGGVCFALLAPPAILILWVTDFGDISVQTFVIYKAILGAALGLIVTPAIALAAMADDRELVGMSVAGSSNAERQQA